MKLSSADKHRIVIDARRQIYHCETVNDCKNVQDYLEELVNFGQIFKCDYYLLRNELNERLRRLIESGCV